MRAIKGNIWAGAAEKWNSFEKIAIKQKDSRGTSLTSMACRSKRFFSSQGRGSKEDARSSGLSEKDLAFCANRFT
jgi:hypothetical protein